MIDITSVTVPITVVNLPTGNFWEADGSCWQYERDEHAERGYRMKPMNLKAFGKIDGPDGPMTDFYLPSKIGGLGKHRA